MKEEPVYAVRFSLALTERRWFFIILCLSVGHLALIFIQAGTLIYTSAQLAGRYTFMTVTTAILCIGLILLGLWKCRSALKIVTRKGCTQAVQLARTREELLQHLRRLAYTLLYASLVHKIIVDTNFLIGIDSRECIHECSTGQLVIILFVVFHGAFVVIVNLLRHNVFDRDVAPSFSAPSTKNSLQRTRTMSSVYTYPQGEGSLYLTPSTNTSGTIRSTSLPPVPSLPAPTPPEDPDVVELSLDKLV